LGWTFVVPVVLLLFSDIAVLIMDGQRGSLTTAVVWTNVFLPPLAVQVAKMFPCLAMQENGILYLMYEAHLGTTRSGS